MENINNLIEELWEEKILVLYHIVDEADAKRIIRFGISITDNFPHALSQKYFISLLEHLKSSQFIVLIAIPDELHKYVYEIEDSFFPQYKKQFDYIEDENFLLNEISGAYSYWDSINDKILNYIPSSLIYGIISKDSKNNIEIHKNRKYYDHLDEQEKNRIQSILKSVINGDIEYDKYLSLIKSSK